jgi:hypothetical protein
MVHMRKTLALAVLATTLVLSTAEQQTDAAVAAADLHPQVHHKHHHKHHHRGHHGKNAHADNQKHYEDEESVDVAPPASGPETYDESYEGSGDVDVDVYGTADLSIDGSGEDDIEIEGYDIELDSSASLDSSDAFEVDGSMDDGSIEVDFEDSEDYDQSMEIEEDQVLDESIDLPVGAKKLHLRVVNGQVELDIIKEAVVQKKKEVVAVAAAATTPESKPVAETKEATKETYAQQASEWLKNNGSKPAFLAGAIGAAVVMVGVAGVAIAKSRKSKSPKSVLDIEAAEEEEQAASDDQDEDADGNESSSDESSADEEDETTEDAEEKTEAAGVVEGSV